MYFDHAIKEVKLSSIQAHQHLANPLDLFLILSFYLSLLIAVFALHVYFRHHSNKQSKRDEEQDDWLHRIE